MEQAALGNETRRLYSSKYLMSCTAPTLRNEAKVPIRQAMTVEESRSPPVTWDGFGVTFHDAHRPPNLISDASLPIEHSTIIVHLNRSPAHHV